MEVQGHSSSATSSDHNEKSPRPGSKVGVATKEMAPSDPGPSTSSDATHEDTLPPKKKRTKQTRHPKEAVAVLKQWCKDNGAATNPSYFEKLELVNKTKLTYQQIEYWFRNAHKGMPKIKQKRQLRPAYARPPRVKRPENLRNFYGLIYDQFTRNLEEAKANSDDKSCSPP